MSRLEQRRTFLLSVGGLAAVAAGCDRVSDVGSDSLSIDGAVDAASTSELRTTKLALRGYEIVSMLVAKRVVFLPYPAMRVVAVTLVVSSLAAHLAVQYIDEELVMRKLEEKLSAEERAYLESEGSVEFETASGLSEKVVLGPTEYED